MRQCNGLLSSFLLLLALAIGGATRAGAQQAVTVQGEIVDLNCYMAKGAKGPAHKACAQACAKKGMPIGLLSAHQGVFLLLADEADPASYDAAKGLVGEQAEVSGKQFSKDGMASIVVGSVKQAAASHAAAGASQGLAVNQLR